MFHVKHFGMNTIEKTSYFLLKLIVKALYTALIFGILGLFLLAYRSQTTEISIQYTIPLLIESARNPALMLKYFAYSVRAELKDPFLDPESIGYLPPGNAYRWVTVSYDLPDRVSEKEIQLLTEENGVYSQSLPLFYKKDKNMQAYYLIMSRSRVRALIYQGNILTLWK